MINKSKLINLYLKFRYRINKMIKNKTYNAKLQIIFSSLKFKIFYFTKILKYIKTNDIIPIFNY